MSRVLHKPNDAHSPSDKQLAYTSVGPYQMLFVHFAAQELNDTSTHQPAKINLFIRTNQYTLNNIMQGSNNSK